MESLWPDSPTHGHLTDYTERLAEDQWDLSLERRCVQVSEDTYWVYMPHNSEVDKGKFYLCQYGAKMYSKWYYNNIIPYGIHILF